MGRNLGYLQSLSRWSMTSLNTCLVAAGLAAAMVFFLTDLVCAQWLQLGERQGSFESVTEYLREDLQREIDQLKLELGDVKKQLSEKEPGKGEIPPA